MKSSSVDSKTFITGVQNASQKPLSLTINQKEVPKVKEINEYYGDLNNIIDDLNTKISDVIQYHEKDFFAAFKNRMYQIKQEMKVLKEKASKERLEMKREERMATLQNERDWFRNEALGTTQRKTFLNCLLAFLKCSGIRIYLELIQNFIRILNIFLYDCIYCRKHSINWLIDLELVFRKSNILIILYLYFLNSSLQS